jgi:hypothetical protein
MILDNLLTVTIEDAVFVFEEPNLRDWAVIIDINAKRDLSEQVKLVSQKLVSVENLSFKNGTPITVDDIKAGNIPVKLGMFFVNKWSEAVVNTFKTGEAETKKELEPGLNGSLNQDSTSQTLTA